MAAAGSFSVQMLANTPMTGHQPRVYRWVKTECGQAKYAELAARTGVLARLRLAWFVLMAALRDWPLP
ncbi:hypothetical protein KBZ14_05065 [Synechococcus sp. HJ21-Hayes]|jgi:hypothetical protein|uniref:hypothetical protein n=1 Tax=unclassified Synechococcus TaxID=2626047 RepID=UPI0020CC4D21|nr:MULTISPECIES: hypothetical protein [unclassified Synechococcus]MCP9831254.1 hypothetical protein [Synechococcus sp. JJ3a-Johnson]MCP9852240.1 hypothetical protein [Synechococcus sp. HJ21-Hayes]